MTDHDTTEAQLRRRTREDREAEEAERLSPAAQLASQSRGRAEDEPQDDYRTCFERDRDRILHSKAFRRLKHKTQVFLNPDGDHYVTRMTHTLQVAQVGRSISAALGLNEALCEAQCLGHDIGHSLFGHTGEEALSPYLPEDQEWQHAIHGVRVVSVLEPLNLTAETLDGIRQSSWRNDPPPFTAEGMALRFADRIAYLSHDALDAMRADVLTIDDFPQHVLQRFGSPGREWIDAMIRAVIDESVGQGEVTMEPDALQAMHDLRDFMFSDVYLRPESVEQAQKAIRVIRDLFEWFVAHPDEVPQRIREVSDGDQLQAAMDHVAGMSDKYAIREHDRLFRPAGLYSMALPREGDVRSVVEIRDGLETDLPAVAAVYTHYVLNTTTTFHTQVRTPAEWRDRYRQHVAEGPYHLLVGEVDGQVVGYCETLPFRPKPAYLPSIELSIYVAPDAVGHGVGSALVEHLLVVLEGSPFHRLYSIITLPNDQSVAFHERHGFVHRGTLTEAGRKFDAYLDVAFYERALDDA